ncbi:MAG: hypothetical protein IIB31_09515, partial [Chloroflexi bacterium]|nr:hypothetical protein [Chloroflexota bacterium]
MVFQQGSSTVDEFLARIIGTLGAATSRFSDEAVANNRLQNEFQNLRDSTSGVSIDEEVTLLIQFQRSF